MPEYEFTLKFKLQDSQIDPDIYVEQLYESNCDDAVVGTGKKCYIGLNLFANLLQLTKQFLAR